MEWKGNSINLSLLNNINLIYNIKRIYTVISQPWNYFFYFSTTQEVNKLMSQIPPSIAALTGVDISSVISGLNSDGVKV